MKNKLKKQWGVDMRNLEVEKTNIKEFIDKIVTIKDVTVEENGDMSITKLDTDKGEISTTSKVLMEQAISEKEKGLPFKAKIELVRSKNKFAYYKLAPPVE